MGLADPFPAGNGGVREVGSVLAAEVATELTAAVNRIPAHCTVQRTPRTVHVTPDRATYRYGVTRQKRQATQLKPRVSGCRMSRGNTRRDRATKQGYGRTASTPTTSTMRPSSRRHSGNSAGYSAEKSHVASRHVHDEDIVDGQAARACAGQLLPVGES